MDTYTAIYTDILLANNAKVGQAVFNGDYMFSQNGINASGDAVSGTEYIKFDASDPYKESNEFRPTWCVNLKTGQQWMGNGTCTFRANGSGYVANGAIAWDANGVVTSFPKSGSATITATGDSKRKYVSVEANVSEDYGTIENAIVYISSAQGNVIAQSFVEFNENATTITINHPTGAAFDADCVVKLFINGKLAAANNIVFKQSTTPSVVGTICSVTLKVSGDRDTIWLHSGASRDTTQGDVYDGVSVDEGIASVMWNTATGLTINGSKPGIMEEVFVGDYIYVYTSATTANYATRFQLLEQNQVHSVS